MPLSYGNDKFKYVINFSDEYTGHVTIYGLKSKAAAEVAEQLRYFLADTAGIGQIKCMLTDNGGEFKGEFQELCKDREIELRRSVPYYHDGNPRSERAFGM